MVTLPEAHRKEAVRRLEKEFARRNFVTPSGLEVEEGVPEIKQPDFLDHVKILERAQLHSGVSGGAVPFQKWPYLVDLAQSMVDHRLVTVLKARQLGFSWTSAAYAAWLLTFSAGTNVLMISKGQTEAFSLLDKVRFILKNLPPDWQAPLSPDSRSEIGIPSRDSKVIALPSTEDAGRSETASVVIQDEADFHEYHAANYAAVKPTIDAGGQMIMGSTSNKRNMSSLFKELYRNSPDNGWKKVFIPWNARPGRTQIWYDGVRDTVPAIDLQGMSPEQFMEQEYPGEENEALAPPKAQSIFDRDIIAGMADDCIKPIREVGPASIYQEPRSSRRYVAGTDVASGVGMDYSVTVIVDVNSGYVVADLVSNTLQPEDFSTSSMQLLEVYANPEWAIENNFSDTVLTIARDMNYPRLYRRRVGRGKNIRREYGWRTDRMSRQMLFDELRASFNAGHLTIPNKQGLDEFTTIIAAPGEKPQAMGGAHDDYVMALGIALMLKNEKGINNHGKIIRLPAFA
tara:strand:+ start:481 stop:2022 length:1542 start_codon:yes stop_codon:yes gene_type:complete